MTDKLLVSNLGNLLGRSKSAPHVPGSTHLDVFMGPSMQGPDL